MEDDWIRIAITPPEIAPQEAKRIVELLDDGFSYVHIRHPEASLRDVRHLLEAIPQRLHGRLRLHGFFELASEFNIGGLHLNHRCPEPPAFYSGPLSRSCHSLDEVWQTGEGFDYVLLSPIYDSISKPGYKSAFTYDELRRFHERPHLPVIALGGVTPAKYDELRALGFSGAAHLGSVWN
ncbi:MAG: thiamine phosphate synthase [Bacteroidales bacterium]|nr:thiamine phosphate synthase [Bacteroidales bacterium]